MISLRKRLRSLDHFDRLFAFPLHNFGIHFNNRLNNDDRELSLASSFSRLFQEPLEVPSELHADENLKKRPKFHSYSTQTFSVTQNGHTKKHVQHNYTDSNGVDNQITTKYLDGKEHKQVRIGDKITSNQLKNVDTVKDFENLWERKDVSATETIEDANVKASEDSNEEHDKGESFGSKRDRLLKSIGEFRKELSNAKSAKNYKKCISLKKSVEDTESALNKLKEEEANAKLLAEQRTLRSDLSKLNEDLKKAEENEDFEKCLAIHEDILRIEGKLKQ